MNVRTQMICVLSAAFLVGLPACGSDGETDNGEIADAGDDVSVEDVEVDGSQSEADAGPDTDDGGDDSGPDADPEPGDIAVDYVSVLHEGGSEWLLDVSFWNAGGMDIEMDHCTYEARTVADDTLIADGTIHDDGFTLYPPEPGQGDYAYPMPTLEFEPSEGDATVEAEMSVTCVAADGENEENTDNNTATGTFDW